jgi:hypothetical protein
LSIVVVVGGQPSGDASEVLQTSTDSCRQSTMRKSKP